MGQITAKQCEELTVLRKEGVLEEVAPHSIDLARGAIILPCSDGDQMDDLYSHLRDICIGQLLKPRLHTLALNGGAPLISGEWPNPLPGQVLLPMIMESRQLKDMDTVLLFSHAPCGAAARHGYSVEHMINLLMLSKARLKSECRDLRVICFFHVDWYEGGGGTERKQRTYFISRSKWLGYLQRQRVHCGC